MRQMNLTAAGALILLALFWTGCRKTDLTPGVQPITIVVNASYDPSGGHYDFPLTGIAIKLKNLLTGNEYEALTDDKGIVVFKDLSAGTYDAEAVASIPRETYESVTGITIDEESVILNANLSNLMLNSSTDNVIPLMLQLGKLGDWVFKQIYYAGSHTKDGAVFRDQFIELYNNSNDTLYADGLYFTQLAGNRTAMRSVDLTKGYYIDNTADPLYMHYDWSKSINMPAGIGAKANTDYVYARSLFRIPGSGEEYPVYPGESIIIAATALNHKAPYVDIDGEAITVNNPDLTVDLSNADFEVYLRDVISNAFASDINNPTVPNLLVITPGDRDLVLDATGREAYAIFRTNVDIKTEWNQIAAPDQKEISSSTDLYFQIPVDVVLDAVAIMHPNPSSRLAKKLPPMLDASFTFAPAGQYSSQSIIRKVAKTVDGRKILMDTNNSSNDFDYLEKAEPGAFK